MWWPGYQFTKKPKESIVEQVRQCQDLTSLAKCILSLVMEEKKVVYEHKVCGGRNEGLQSIKQQKMRVYVLYLYIYRDLETINPHLQAIYLQTYNLLKNLQGDNYRVWGPINEDLQTSKIMNENLGIVAYKVTKIEGLCPIFIHLQRFRNYKSSFIGIQKLIGHLASNL